MSNFKSNVLVLVLYPQFKKPKLKTVLNVTLTKKHEKNLILKYNEGRDMTRAITQLQNRK